MRYLFSSDPISPTWTGKPGSARGLCKWVRTLDLASLRPPIKTRYSRLPNSFLPGEEQRGSTCERGKQMDFCAIIAKEWMEGGEFLPSLPSSVDLGSGFSAFLKEDDGGRGFSAIFTRERERVGERDM